MVALLAGLGYATILYRKMLISQNPSYTIGFASYTTDNDRSVMLNYNVRGQKYEIKASANLLYYHNKLGKRYFVVFDKNKPQYSRVIYSVSVPDTLLTVPVYGWQEIPLLLPNRKPLE